MGLISFNHYYIVAGAGQDEPFDSSVLRGKQERYKLGEGQLIHGLEVMNYFSALFYIDCYWSGGDQDNDQERESTFHDRLQLWLWTLWLPTEDP